MLRGLFECVCCWSKCESLSEVRAIADRIVQLHIVSEHLPNVTVGMKRANVNGIHDQSRPGHLLCWGSFQIWRRSLGC